MSSLNHSGNDYAKRLAEQARTPKEFQVESKIYFHHHNYAKFIFDLGGSRVKAVAFANHRYITDDKREQDQLDLVADVPGTFIYTLADNDVARAMIEEQARMNQEDVMRAAQASAAVNNQVFDPNTPIIPVHVQHVQQTAMQLTPVANKPAVVGMQNSLSGTQAVAPITTPVSTVQQSPADAARARLEAVAKGGASPQ